jgi:hypothetical protein
MRRAMQCDAKGGAAGLRRYHPRRATKRSGARSLTSPRE